jgi:uncharacterized membrane protein YbhN (UPF0104 family)
MKVLLRLAVVAVAAIFLARGVSWGEVARILARTRLPLLGVVVALNAAMMGVKAWRLRLLLDDQITISTSYLTRLSVSALNNLVPFRSGDLARLWMLERHARIDKTRAAVVALFELLLGLVTLCVLVILAAPGTRGQRWAVLSAPIALVAGAVLLVLLAQGRGARAAGPEPPGRFAWVRAVWRVGFPPLQRPRRASAVVALSLADWLIEATMIVVTSWAAGLTVGFPLAIVGLLGLNLAIALPSMPASAGAFEAGLSAVLVLAGVPKSAAVSFAILYHLVQVIPVTTAGAVVILRGGFTLRGLRSWPGREA